MTTDQLISPPAPTPCPAIALHPAHVVQTLPSPGAHWISTVCPGVTALAPWSELHPARDVEANPVLERIALAAENFPVLADCGCAEDYGQIVHTVCDLRLCGDHAATHTCQPCDVDAFTHGEG
jgi:hypothetical protein